MGRKPKESKCSPYKIGQKVTFYLDPMFEEQPLGTALLLCKSKEASVKEAFIVEDDVIDRQKVYSIEEWTVRVLEVTDLGVSYNIDVGSIVKRKFKYLFNIGPTPSGVQNIYEMEGKYSDKIAYKKPTFIDNFEAVEGWGQQF